MNDLVFRYLAPELTGKIRILALFRESRLGSPANFFTLMNIFVAQLSYSTKEDKLREMFEAHGEVSSAKIIIDKVENRSKGFGFVEMPNDDEARNAINALNEAQVDGRSIVVKEARERESNSGGGGYRGGGGGRNRY
jgi:RNA recognition motif-containing protein